MTAGVTGIVLAGGASSRFGSDKLLATLDGRPLLERAIEAVGEVGAEVLVVVAPGDKRELPAAARTGAPVRRIQDYEQFGGPLVGLLAGLEAAREPVALVAGADMPTLSIDVLRLLIHELTRSDSVSEAAVLVRQGALRPLPSALRNGAATQAARRLLGEDERSLRALIRDLRTRAIPEGDWRSLDPTGETLRDVDMPEDLDG
jgi:molybdopterin-guanine dinucleotide biosynthesis protein A